MQAVIDPELTGLTELTEAAAKMLGKTTKDTVHALAAAVAEAERKVRRRGAPAQQGRRTRPHRRDRHVRCLEYLYVRFSARTHLEMAQ